MEGGVLGGEEGGEEDNGGVEVEGVTGRYEEGGEEGEDGDTHQ